MNQSIIYLWEADGGELKLGPPWEKKVDFHEECWGDGKRLFVEDKAYSTL